MKMKAVCLLYICICLFCIGGLTSYSSGPASSGSPFVGEPGANFGFTCGTQGCHGDATYGVPAFDVKVKSLNGDIFLDSYIPLEKHLIEITILPEFGTPAGYGFGATILGEDDNQAGIFSNASPNAQISYVSFVNRQYVEHKHRSTDIFSFVWTAPLEGVITIYVNGVVANGDGERDSDSGGTTPFSLELQPQSLAVELSEFKASQQGREVLLQWTTDTETNNDYFLIEHSIDGTGFQDLHHVVGAVNSDVTNMYNYLHNAPQNGDNYYRLKIVDTDGKATYSKIEVINIDITSSISINVYPQPTTDKSNIVIYSDEKTDAQIDIYTLTGQAVKSIHRTLQIGKNTIILNNQQLKNGTYMIVVQSNFGTAIEQLIKI